MDLLSTQQSPSIFSLDATIILAVLVLPNKIKFSKGPVTITQKAFFFKGSNSKLFFWGEFRLGASVLH